MTWSEKLREAAKWFDTVDRLIEMIEIRENGEVQRMVDYLGGPSHEIQDDLRQLATIIEIHDAERGEGICAAPLEFYADEP